uniref:Uncharacterized protein n=1 Tax=Rhizophagus irregularis (strain DAOM 181602 / DAOM 197198 / MUCL 43194) TaxID=747089 RepID=U9T5A9_RHIID
MKKLTLDDAFAIAKERSRTCVSTEYINASTPMRWKYGAHIVQLIDLLLSKMQSN